jgi:beta-glucosidase-like glycosyl hydrolase
VRSAFFHFARLRKLRTLTPNHQGVDAGVPRLGIPALSNLIECTGAVSSNCYISPDGTSYCPTVFPAPLAVAASFNRSLMRLRGAVTGMEARAFNNLNVNRVYGNPVDLLAFGPDINLIVDPRNGRNGENPVSPRAHALRAPKHPNARHQHHTSARRRTLF